jgi:hypothetical protein
MKKLFAATVLCGALQICFSQPVSKSPQLKRMADSLYNAQDYAAAFNYYWQLIELFDYNTRRLPAFFNAACCLAKQNKIDSAFVVLNKMVTLGFSSKRKLLNESNLTTLQQYPQWQKLLDNISEIKYSLNDDPLKARFITTDVDNFWVAYEKANKDTANFYKILKSNYTEKASRGMEDYFNLKVSSLDALMSHVKSAPKYYTAIKKNTLLVAKYIPAFTKSFVSLKEIYPAAKFPDVYFVMGAFTSGGTVSPAGLLIGVNQTVLDDAIPITEFDSILYPLLNSFATLPNMIAHELIHFQQKGMASDTTTLAAAITEGMADFIGELISGQVANPNLHKWAIGKEKQIWLRFKEDMYLDKTKQWIANSRRVTPGQAPDQGYWVGYQICKAYYNKAQDKKQAIAAMLTITNYNQFFEASGWQQAMEAMQ